MILAAAAFLAGAITGASGTTTSALIIAAHSGDTAAMFALGQRYEFGTGAPQDYDKALMWYQAAADAGDARAINTLALWQIEGIDVAKDEPAGQALLRKAAEAGEPAAMMNLATRFEKGTAWLAKDSEKAAVYLAKAVARYRELAEAVEVRAMFQIGVLYGQGRGVPQDDAVAAQWFEKAASHDDTSAMLSLANLCAEGRGIKRDNQKIFSLCAKAAELGNPRALYNLGVAYAHGRGVAKDEAKALEYYRAAANGAYPEAMNNLGLMYIAGRGAERNAAEGVDWFQRAATLGNLEAMHNLSQAYRKGIGVAIDLTKADEWEQRASVAAETSPPH